MSVYTRELILEVLAEMKYFNKQTTEVGLQRDRSQLYEAIEFHFGSLNNALHELA